MKGVILAAGYGSRFLPTTKSLPKEMLPLGGVPALQWIVDEMLSAGITDILVVSSRRKKALEDYFDREPELENAYAGDPHKTSLIAPPKANVFFVRQQRMTGAGDALLLCEPFVGNSPFIVAYPDDVHIGTPSLSAQLKMVHQKTNTSVLAVRTAHAGEDLSRYGIVATTTKNGTAWVTAMVEKPAGGKEPGRLISLGRYLYTADIFSALKVSRAKHKADDGEFTQTAALLGLISECKVAAQLVEGTVMDVGEPEGYLRSVFTCALQGQGRQTMLQWMHDELAKEEKK